MIKIVPYNDLVNLTRVCIPITMSCNLKCKFCMRHEGKLREPKFLSDDTRRLLTNLDPQKTEAVIMNGGEPLLRLDRIKEIFSIIPASVHKKIMTNGTLLTDEIIDYIIDNDIELHLSHCGEASEFLMGVDILKDEKMVKRINRVRYIRVNCPITNRNANVRLNYEYIKSKLKSIPHFWFSYSPIYRCGKYTDELRKDFDFDLYAKSILELYALYGSDLKSSSHQKKIKGKKSNGFMVMPDGSVVGMNTLQKYGTIRDKKEDLYNRSAVAEDVTYCRTHKDTCPLKESCGTVKQTCDSFIQKVNVLQYNLNGYMTSHV